MTEIPEHLLKRAAEARSRTAGGGGGDAESAAPTATSAAPAPAPAPIAAAAVPEEPATPDPVAPYVEAGLGRKRVPVWIIPVLLFLPIWAIFYVGYLERPPAAGGGLLAEGAEVYATSCAGCHGGTGGGGAGHQLNGGEVLLTFPSLATGAAFDGVAHHLAWVSNGTAGTDALSPLGYGDPARPGGGRVPGGLAQMSGFGGSLSTEELVAAVYYERFTHGGLDPAAAETELLVLEEVALLIDEEGLDLGAGVAVEEMQAIVDEARAIAGAGGESAAG